MTDSVQMKLQLLQQLRDEMMSSAGARFKPTEAEIDPEEEVGPADLPTGDMDKGNEGLAAHLDKVASEGNPGDDMSLDELTEEDPDVEPSVPNSKAGQRLAKRKSAMKGC